MDSNDKMQNTIDLYKEIEYHLLLDNKPSIYLEKIYDNLLFSQFPFEMLKKLKDTEQSPIHHKEGNVWIHTLMVVDQAAKKKNESKNQKVFMWAAFLHDIGKPNTTKVRNGRITAYDHDKEGGKLARKFLSHFTQDKEFIEQVGNLVRYHMHIMFLVRNLPYADMRGLKKHTDIHEIALLGLCDRLGRADINKKEEENNIRLFLKKFPM